MKVRTSTRLMAMVLAGAVLTGPMLADSAVAAIKKPTPAQKPAPEQDAALTRDAARAHAIEIFDRLDFNHDGTFNAADHEARRAAHLGEQFDRIDANHDGSITKAEFIAAHSRAPGGPRSDTPPPGPGPQDHGRGPEGRGFISPMVFDILRDADPQHTGSVTKDAFIAAELKRFDAADADHDGKVTQEELRAARHAERDGWHRGWGPRGEGFRHGPHGGDTPPPPPPPPPPAPTDAAK